MITFYFTLGWGLLLGLSLIMFTLFSLVRKSIEGAIKFGLIGFSLAVCIEIIGIGTNLWAYTGGNWPLILWPTYLIYSMTFYQIVKVVEKRL